MRMSKIIVALVCMASLLPATLMAAEATLDLPVNSAYVWRGQVLNDEAVLQPSLSVSAENGLSFSTWANWNLTDSLGESSKNEFNEVDLTVSYDVPVEVIDLSVGVADYEYPNQTVAAADETSSAFALPSTREAFVSVGKEDLILSPSLGVYYDFGQVNAFYALIGVSQGYDVSEELSLTASLSVGAADSDYNSYYFGVDSAKLNDGNAKLGATYAFSEAISVSAYAMYTYLLDSAIRDAAKENDAYFNKGDIFSGGVSLAYDF